MRCDVIGASQRPFCGAAPYARPIVNALAVRPSTLVAALEVSGDAGHEILLLARIRGARPLEKSRGLRAAQNSDRLAAPDDEDFTFLGFVELKRRVGRVSFAGRLSAVGASSHQRLLRASACRTISS